MNMWLKIMHSADDHLKKANSLAFNTWFSHGFPNPFTLHWEP